MIPLHDDNPTTNTAYVTIFLIAACAVMFLWQLSLAPSALNIAQFTYGVVPASLVGHVELPQSMAKLPSEFTIITSMFLHGGWMHLLGNMLFLWIFGNNVEDSMGHTRFAVFYCVGGAAGAIAHAASDTSSMVPMIGASGAISAVLGAYLLLFPRARVLVITPFISLLLRLPAVIVLVGWFAIQLTNLAGREAGVAWWAHVGGFVAGVVLIPFFKRSEVMLFAPARSGPEGVMLRPAEPNNDDASPM